MRLLERPASNRVDGKTVVRVRFTLFVPHVSKRLAFEVPEHSGAPRPPSSGVNVALRAEQMLLSAEGEVVHYRLAVGRIQLSKRSLELDQTIIEGIVSPG